MSDESLPIPLWFSAASYLARRKERIRVSTTTRGPCGRGNSRRASGKGALRSLKSPPGIETSMTEFRRQGVHPPGDCAVRLLVRICRRTGILGGTKGAPLMKNFVPFYRSQYTESIPHWCTSRLGERLTKERFKFMLTSGLALPGCCQGLGEQPDCLCG